MMNDVAISPDDVLAALLGHRGHANGVSARDLARRLGVSERRLRTLISSLIMERGVAIAGFPATGYFIAETAEEVERNVAFHRDRALHELRKASVLSRIPLPELLGQMKLKT